MNYSWIIYKGHITFTKVKKLNLFFINFNITCWLISSVQSRPDTISMWGVCSSNHQGAVFVLPEGADDVYCWLQDCCHPRQFWSHSFMWFSRFQQQTPTWVWSISLHALAGIPTVITWKYNFCLENTLKYHLLTIKRCNIAVIRLSHQN